MKSRVSAIVMCAALFSAVVGCGSDTASDAGDEATTSSASDSGASTASSDATTDESTPTAATPDASAAGAVSIDVRIENGTVTPTNERIDAVVGEPVTIRVDSDAADELHVHSVPDHAFDVEAAQGQVFEFVVDVPGQVALELHDAGKTVATLLVRP